MSRYLETAAEINTEIKALVERLNLSNADVAKLGYIVNLAIRSCPRGVQHTVRKNIVETAVRGFCHVSMHEVQNGEHSFHKIEITPCS